MKIITFIVCFVLFSTIVFAQGGGQYITIIPSSDAGWAVGGSQTVQENELDFETTLDADDDGIYDWYEDAVGADLIPTENYDSDSCSDMTEFCNLYAINGESVPYQCQGYVNPLCITNCDLDSICDIEDGEYYWEGYGCPDCETYGQGEEEGIPEFSSIWSILLIVILALGMLYFKEKIKTKG